MKSSAYHTAKYYDGEKFKPQYEATTRARNPNQGQPAYKRQTLPILSPSPFYNFKTKEHFTPLKLTINMVFNAIKDQLWVRRPKLIQYFPQQKSIVPSTIAMGT